MFPRYTRLKPVIPELVHHDFVCREISDVLRKCLFQFVDCKQQGRLTYLIPMRAVFPMPNRANGKKNP